MTEQQKTAIQEAALHICGELNTGTKILVESAMEEVITSPSKYVLFTEKDMRNAFYAGYSLCDDEWRDRRKLVGFDEFIKGLTAQKAPKEE